MHVNNENLTDLHCSVNEVEEYRYERCQIRDKLQYPFIIDAKTDPLKSDGNIQ
jgi:hypothetical protein